jgi:hypothetical protein
VGPDTCYSHADSLRRDQYNLIPNHNLYLSQGAVDIHESERDQRPKESVHRQRCRIYGRCGLDEVSPWREIRLNLGTLELNEWPNRNWVKVHPLRNGG